MYQLQWIQVLLRINGQNEDHYNHQKLGCDFNYNCAFRNR